MEVCIITILILQKRILKENYAELLATTLNNMKAHITLTMAPLAVDEGTNNAVNV